MCNTEIIFMFYIVLMPYERYIASLLQAFTSDSKDVLICENI